MLKVFNSLEGVGGIIRVGRGKVFLYTAGCAYDLLLRARFKGESNKQDQQTFLVTESVWHTILI